MRRRMLMCSAAAAMSFGPSVVGVPALASGAAGPGAPPPVPVVVLTPPGYQHGRWPVVYVLNAGCGSPCTAATLPPSVRQLKGRPWISVIETSTHPLADYASREDGAPNSLRDYPLALTAWADRHLRTMPHPQSRVLMGISAGGYGALLVASRVPGMFAAVVGISAPADLRASDDALEPAFFETNSNPPVGDVGAFGVPLADDPTWAVNNPGDLAANLAHTRVLFGSGTGTPCATTNPTAFVPAIESLVRQSQAGYARDLDRAGVHYTWLREPCGGHEDPTFRAEVAAWLKQGSPFSTSRSPAAFEQLDWAPALHAYGWTARVDKRRAVEPMLLAVNGRRARLTGTGTTTVTAPAPGCRAATRPVVAVGGRGQPARIGRAGAVTFTVRLGAADTAREMAPYGPPGSVPLPGPTARIVITCSRT